ncbi:alkaline phosphatase [Rubrivivax benzoatilyticus]|uniref:Alkaline phosphatase n=1 Tax=Rubrivivax benzoatilyticus TaxID=316997 RepID=A0ABX0HP37_9BURK|nr:alkaline phosphatase [Rubrivivax benzoatilyticus]EGJ10464.1 alkaline phosphatase [Rubrivivax benzoatilyticus JA2 = ATCC BAA-35]NHK96833.1 alkaline phosphatase [Rubrivivax benzoatilyticus]NHL24548.1 alkaline phosphatase [Rubrivivax benzoatilyticus]
MTRRPTPPAVPPRRTVFAALAAAALLSACAAAPSAPAPAKPKNVIVMISDGASWNTWEMAAHFRAGTRANDLPEYQLLTERWGVTTFPLNTSTKPTHDATPQVSYDPARAWDPSPVAPVPGDAYATAIAGYQYLKRQYTDSAAAGTALASGSKTYNNAINVDNFGQPLDFATRIARGAGKATGVVTSVPLAHATPAAFGARNASRSRMTELARDMLRDGNLDLIMGAGHPEHDGNGASVLGLSAADCAARTACSKRWDVLAEAEWRELRAGTLRPAGAERPWTLVEDRTDFERLAAGQRRVDGPLVGIPRVRWTLQQAREEEVLGADPAQPSGVRRIANVPDLATMAGAALRHLERDPDGLFLMIEGGAVDWAAHANQAGRLVEEQAEFNAALAVVEAWIAAHGGWQQNLLIVTTDHGNAMPMGPQSDRVAFQPVPNGGAGVRPAPRFWSDNHTNELVRLWARGAGAERFAAHQRGRDPRFAEVTGHNDDGRYVDNTDVFRVVKAALDR